MHGVARYGVHQRNNVVVEREEALPKGLLTEQPGQVMGDGVCV